MSVVAALVGAASSYRLCAVACVALSVASCSEAIEVANQPAVIEATGEPTLVGPGVVSFAFTIVDFERDDQELIAIACEAGGGACGAPVRAPGSDRLDFVPAGPRDEPSEHRFSWALGCGRLTEAGAIATDLGASYDVTIKPRGSGRAIEPQFVSVSLAALGAVAPLSCEGAP